MWARASRSCSSEASSARMKKRSKKDQKEKIREKNDKSGLHAGSSAARARRSRLHYLLEGVAGCDGSVLKSALEPLRALGRTSVGEGLGVHASAGHALQSVIAHCGCGLQAFVNISRVQQVALLGGVPPDAGETICL